MEIAVDLESIGVESIEGLDRCSDYHDQHYTDEGIEDLECDRECFVPAEVRMRGTENSLSEDEVDEEQNQHACRYEDLCSDGDLDVVWVAGRHNSHDHGDDPGHTETKSHGAHNELVTLAVVQLEDGHVSGRASNEEDEEDGTDGHVDADIGLATDSSEARRVGRVHGLVKVSGEVVSIE